MLAATIEAKDTQIAQISANARTTEEALKARIATLETTVEASGQADLAGHVASLQQQLEGTSAALREERNSHGSTKKENAALERQVNSADGVQLTTDAAYDEMCARLAEAEHARDEAFADSMRLQKDYQAKCNELTTERKLRMALQAKLESTEGALGVATADRAHLETQVAEFQENQQYLPTAPVDGNALMAKTIAFSDTDQTTLEILFTDDVPKVDEAVRTLSDDPRSLISFVSFRSPVPGHSPITNFTLSSETHTYIFIVRGRGLPLSMQLLMSDSSRVKVGCGADGTWKEFATNLHCNVRSAHDVAPSLHLEFGKAADAKLIAVTTWRAYSELYGGLPHDIDPSAATEAYKISATPGSERVAHYIAFVAWSIRALFGRKALQLQAESLREQEASMVADFPNADVHSTPYTHPSDLGVPVIAVSDSDVNAQPSFIRRGSAASVASSIGVSGTRRMLSRPTSAGNLRSSKGPSADTYTNGSYGGTTPKLPNTAHKRQGHTVNYWLP